MDLQRWYADRCPLKLSIKLRTTSSTCRCLNWPIGVSDVAVMGCQSPCNQGEQHVQLHGQTASILKCKQTITIMMRECSSRNTVQFLDEIDRNHESQLRKLLWILIGCYIVEYLVFYLLYWKKITYITKYITYLSYFVEIAWISCSRWRSS